MTYTVLVDEISPGPLTNRVTVSFDGFDPNPENNSTASDEVTVTPVADLAVTKDDGITVAVPGEPITYTLILANNGPDIAETQFRPT
jgi:hypothetical protein